MKDKHKN